MLAHNSLNTARSVAVVATVLASIGLGWFFRDLAAGKNADLVVSNPKATEEEIKTTVVLSESKQKNEHLRVEPCTRGALQDERIIAGRLTYDQSSHVTVRAPVDGRVQEILVKPGDNVQQGDVIAILTSPTVGDARGEVLRRLADLHIAEEELAWQTQVSVNLAKLVESLKTHPEIKEVEQAFEKKVLGDYREIILSPYSKYRLAESIANNVTNLGNQGALEGRVVRERTSNREVFEAEFRGKCEQSLFDAHHKHELSKGRTEDARRKYQVASNALASLLGREEDLEQIDSAKLSQLELRAPLSGTIEERNVVKTERVTAGDALFVVANISKLWVTADIRERDWDLTNIEPGTKISVQIPALQNETFSATVHYVGRVVGDASRALPLVALIDNLEFRMRPGMFVRVKIALKSEAKEVIIIPSSALLAEDKTGYVFVEEKPGTYHRTNIEIGRENEQFIEVTGGLQEGDRVVVEGTFMLKSELTLEAEE